MTGSPAVRADNPLGEQLPPSWAFTTLGTVTDYGRTEKVEPEDIPAGAWVLELEDIEKDSSRILQRRTQSERQSLSTKNRFGAGDVLYGKLRPYLNKVVIADAPGFCTTEIVPLQPGTALERRYLFHWLKHPAFLKYVEAASHGMNMPRLGTDAGRAAPLVLAPLPEQTRIADQLDTLLARIQACQDRLEAIPALLKRFRQAALDAAMTGELTNDWHTPGQQGLSAADVIATRLGNEKGAARRKLEEFLLEHPPQEPGPGLPSGWLRTHVGVVGAVSNGSTPSRGAPEYWGGDIPWVSSGEVANRAINTTRESITSAGFENSSVRLLPAGTVLMAMIGEGKTRGQSALLAIPACINQNVAGVVPVPELVASRYLWYWFQRQYESTRKQGSGSGPKALNCDRVRRLEVHLPPLGEQAEIVRRLEAMLSLADGIAARCASATADVQRLAPLTLAKAFRGDLVAQDPNDEPASVLLARIATERIAPVAAIQARVPRRGRPPRAPKESATMTKSRQDDDVMGQPYLAGHLRRMGSPSSAEALFKVAELPVADFYKQLAWEVAQGHVKDNQTTLEPGHAAG